MRLILVLCSLIALAAAGEPTNNGVNINSNGCRCLVDAPLKVCAGRTFEMTVNLLSDTKVDKDFPIELKGTADAHFDSPTGPKVKKQQPCPSVGKYTVHPGNEGGKKIEVWVGTALCKEIEVVKVDLFLKSATFAGPRHEVYQDSLTRATKYPTPHWLDKNDNLNASELREHRFPVCYTRATKPELGATFRVILPPGQAFPAVKVRGTGPDGVNFPAKAVTYDAAAKIATYPSTIADAALPDVIRFYNTFDVRWEMEYEPCTGWVHIGTSDNRMYVTLADPKLTNIFETVGESSCGRADGLASEATAIPAIWGEFTDCSVSKKPLDGYNQPDGAALHYYKTANGRGVTNTFSLLVFLDGQCSSWTSFFLDTLKMQGIKQPRWYVEIRPKAPATSFVVKDWAFAGPGISGDAVFPFLNIRSMTGSAWVYVWRYGQVTDQAGMKGQSTADPTSLFDNHQIARVDVGGTTSYYDPSYGLPHASLDAFETASLAGYLKQATVNVDEAKVGLDLNSDNDKVDLAVPTPSYLFMENGAGNGVSETLRDY